jgi:hypothetical protein
MFRCLTGYRQIGISYDTLNLMFSGFISLTLWVILLCSLIPPSVFRP